MPVLHVPQLPHCELLQQKLPTQKLDWHSLPATHAEPSGLRPHELAIQVNPVAHAPEQVVGQVLFVPSQTKGEHEGAPGDPLMDGTHVPPPHVPQLPHALAQQCPLTQNPELHWLLPVQATVLPSLATHTLALVSQKSPLMQFMSAVQEVGQAGFAPEQTY